MATNSPSIAGALGLKVRKHDERRLELIEESIRLIAAGGIEDLTFDKLGKRFGMKRSLVAYYFKSRKELFLDAVRYVTATAQAMTEKRVAEARSPEDKLFAIIQAALDWYQEHPDQGAVFLLFYFNCSHDASQREIQTEIREQGAQRMAVLLGMLGAKRSKKRLYALAKTIQNLITGFLIDLRVTNPSMSFNEARSAILSSIQTLLREDDVKA
ncbi:TetR family transcriptional regulator [bacterium]|nr:TetR family transcriptional regulator [bacterium]